MPERFISQRLKKGGQNRRKTYLNKSHWTSKFRQLKSDSLDLKQPI